MVPRPPAHEPGLPPTVVPAAASRAGRRRALLALGVLGTSGTLLAGACVLDGFDRAAGTAADAGAPDAADASCQHAWFSHRTDGGDTGDATDLVFAVRSIRVLTDADAGEVPIGLDLDNTCTCQGQESSCVPPTQAEPCDEAEGRDNALPALFAVLGTALGGVDVDDYYTSGAERGSWSLLLRLSGYSGEADDGRVMLAWFVTDGFEGDAGPAWDGQDVWPITADSCPVGADGGPDLNLARYRDEGAYVTDHSVVAGMSSDWEFVLAGTTSSFRMRLSGGGFTGRLEQDDDGIWHLRDGLITGVLRAPDLFSAISTFQIGDGGALCTDNIFYDLAKKTLCEARDILGGFPDPSAPCDALSIGIGFEAMQAHVGRLVTTIAPAEGCPEESSPARDRCD